MELHVVMVGEDHVGEGKRNVTRRRKLFLRRRESHRTAGIDKEIGEEIHLFAKELHVETVGAGEDPPIEIADVIPRRIAPVIGELQTGSPARREVIARADPQDLLARAEPEGLKTIQKLGTKWSGKHNLDNVTPFEIHQSQTDSDPRFGRLLDRHPQHPVVVEAGTTTAVAVAG